MTFLQETPSCKLKIINECDAAYSLEYRNYSMRPCCTNAPGVFHPSLIASIAPLRWHDLVAGGPSLCLSPSACKKTINPTADFVAAAEKEMTAGFQRQEPGGRNRCCAVLTVGKRNERIVARMNDEGGRRDLIERPLSWDIARLVKQDSGETAAHRVHQFQRAKGSAGIFFAEGTLNIFGDADQRRIARRDIFNRQ
jgi:hypothetical protein